MAATAGIEKERAREKEILRAPGNDPLPRSSSMREKRKTITLNL
jgi:hypothetical protein